VSPAEAAGEREALLQRAEEARWPTFAHNGTAYRSEAAWRRQVALARPWELLRLSEQLDEPTRRVRADADDQHQDEMIDLEDLEPDGEDGETAR